MISSDLNDTTSSKQKQFTEKYANMQTSLGLEYSLIQYSYMDPLLVMHSGWALTHIDSSCPMSGLDNLHLTLLCLDLEF